MWTKLSPEDGRIKFDTPGQEVTGRLNRFKQMTIAGHPAEVAYVDTECGEKYFYMTVKLVPLKTVPLGILIRVKYTGNLTTQGGRMKLFEISMDGDDQSTDISTKEGSKVSY